MLCSIPVFLSLTLLAADDKPTKAEERLQALHLEEASR